MQDYAELAGFSSYYLEDSWVLDIEAHPGTLIVVDYLQLLDQRRDKPSLDQQVRELKEHARKCQSIVICLSQIAREFRLGSRAIPSLRDVRLPNSIDLTIFDKACFMHDGKMKLQSTSASGA